MEWLPLVVKKGYDTIRMASSQAMDKKSLRQEEAPLNDVNRMHLRVHILHIIIYIRANIKKSTLTS